jgi:DNA-binding response OmpR family regulator
MYRILVADDEQLISSLLHQALTRHGYSVETASTAREAIRLFDSESFDLVITDMVMPEGGGTAVVRHIRSSRKASIPVMGISGTPWLLQRNLFQKVLYKPFTLDSLWKSVEGLLSGHGTGPEAQWTEKPPSRCRYLQNDLA